jgi:phosphoenolpyruvate-protein kinase (PTS system EI component)
VTDVGGILAHGSIVAREYGIPAVMGTSNATQRIAHGQGITVDGGQGMVYLGEGEREAATSRHERRWMYLVSVLAAAGEPALLIRYWRCSMQGSRQR